MLLAKLANKCGPKCSTGSEPSVLWVLLPHGRGTKTSELSMHFCFGCIIGQRGQVCWWSLPYPHQRGKGFTHLVWQLKIPLCKKQEGSDRTHTDRKCSLAKQGRIWLFKGQWGEWTITCMKNETLCKEHWYCNSSLGVFSHLSVLCAQCLDIFLPSFSLPLPQLLLLSLSCSSPYQFVITVAWAGRKSYIYMIIIVTVGSKWCGMICHYSRAG